MALSYSIKRRGSAGDLAFRIVDVTLDNSYVTGGWPVSAQSLGLGSNGVVQFVLLSGSGRNGYLLEYDHTAKTIKASQGDNPNVAAAPGVQLAAASAVLNGVVVRLLVFGDGHG